MSLTSNILGSWWKVLRKMWRSARQQHGESIANLTKSESPHYYQGDSNNNFFAATVESVLLYGCEARTVTLKLSEDHSGCYTWLLRTVFILFNSIQSNPIQSNPIQFKFICLMSTWSNIYNKQRDVWEPTQSIIKDQSNGLHSAGHYF